MTTRISVKAVPDVNVRTGSKCAAIPKLEEKRPPAVSCVERREETYLARIPCHGGGTEMQARQTHGRMRVCDRIHSSFSYQRRAGSQ